jgi:hypothetical protein
MLRPDYNSYRLLLRQNRRHRALGTSKHCMDWHSALESVGCLLAAVITGLFVFRRATTAKAALVRVPLFIMTGGLCLYIGLLSLPSSFPRVFEAMIGHSIWDDFHFPVDKNGTSFSGTWILVRWIDPLRGLFAVALLVAFVWAIVNLVAGCGRKMNVVALGFCLLWIIVGVYVSLSCFPFCL